MNLWRPLLIKRNTNINKNKIAIVFENILIYFVSITAVAILTSLSKSNKDKNNDKK